MKKGCIFAAAAIITSASGLYTNACVRGQFFWNKIWVVTDYGSINDNSFNQAAYEGANNFILTQTHDRRYHAAYIESPNRSSFFHSQALAIVKANGGENVILPGIDFIPLLGSINHNFAAAVLLDGFNIKPHQQPTFREGRCFFQQPYQNVVDVIFASEISGFEAAWVAAAYFSVHHPGAPAIFASYGGIDNLTTVDEYLFGYVAGLSTWNYVFHSGVDTANIHALQQQGIKIMNQGFYHSGSTALTACIAQLPPSQGVITKTGRIQFLPQQMNIKAANPSNWFSGSYNIGQGIALSQKLILAEQANFIFPVAGAQSADAASIINTNHLWAQTRMIGVDMNQAPVFGDKLVLTSAIKNITLATAEILASIHHQSSSVLGTIQTSASRRHQLWNGVSRRLNYQGDQNYCPPQSLFVGEAASKVMTTLLYGPLTTPHTIIDESAKSVVGLFAWLTQGIKYQTWNNLCFQIDHNHRYHYGNLGQYFVSHLT